jgi:pimeloyl-ACP methyl ester carboxylesterase
MQHSHACLGFKRYGTGTEHILVIHDWLGDHTSYNSIFPYLDGDTFSYVFVDLRGYGRSIHLSGSYTIDEIAADCISVADHLGWERFHIIGHSMSGMATQRIAANVPSRIKSAIAVCPISAAGNNLSDDAAAFFASACENDDAFCRLVKFVTGGLSDRWAAIKLRQNREKVASECKLAYLNMLMTTHFVADVKGLGTPYLIVVGDKDPGLSVSAMRQTFLDWHPNAELEMIPNCGHYPMQECPPYFALIIERFLLRNAG